MAGYFYPDTRHDDLALIIHKQEKKIQFLETKALHLTLFYVLAQLIIFISASSSNVHLCSHRWKAFVVSLLVAVAFGHNIATTVLKYVRTKYEQERNYIHQNENYRRMVYVQRHGSGVKTLVADDCQATDVVIDLPEVYVQQQLTPDMFSVYVQYAHIGLTACVLLGFTVLVMHTCVSSSC